MRKLGAYCGQRGGSFRQEISPEIAEGRTLGDMLPITGVHSCRQPDGRIDFDLAVSTAPLGGTPQDGYPQIAYKIRAREGEFLEARSSLCRLLVSLGSDIARSSTAASACTDPRYRTAPAQPDIVARLRDTFDKPDYGRWNPQSQLMHIKGARGGKTSNLDEVMRFARAECFDRGGVLSHEVTRDEPGVSMTVSSNEFEPMEGVYSCRAGAAVAFDLSLDQVGGPGFGDEYLVTATNGENAAARAQWAQRRRGVFAQVSADHDRLRRLRAELKTGDEAKLRGERVLVVEVKRPLAFVQPPNGSASWVKIEDLQLP